MYISVSDFLSLSTRENKRFKVFFQSLQDYQIYNVQFRLLDIFLTNMLYKMKAMYCSLTWKSNHALIIGKISGLHNKPMTLGEYYF